ncbi:Tn3 family transposase [Nonomuraea sp. LPB2021202275-12-8]|uniref:Tn3 family transposase n=1 Tax=Nonomuraea sp. LPB2021202275-12-8 TaxID=3120159 RepID=UPI00300D3972
MTESILPPFRDPASSGSVSGTRLTKTAVPPISSRADAPPMPMPLSWTAVKGGDIATNRREELEMSVLCLRILQAALVYINTLMLQDVLADREWAKLLKPADRRGLTPCSGSTSPYGEERLDVAKRLPLGGGPGAVQPGGPE